MDRTSQSISKKSLKQFWLNWPPQMPSTFVIIKEMAFTQNGEKSCKDFYSSGLKGFLLLKIMKFLHQVINTKMCTCLWLKWGHTIPYRAKAKKAVALCPLGSRHDLHWSREKGNEIFASSAFQYCTLGNFKFTFMPSSSLHYFFPCIMEWKMFFMLRVIQ